MFSKKILVKGSKRKKGNYDTYLIPENIEDFSYTKDGKEIKGSQYKFKIEFPPVKGKQGQENEDSCGIVVKDKSEFVE